MDTSSWWPISPGPGKELRSSFKPNASFETKKRMSMSWNDENVTNSRNSRAFEPFYDIVIDNGSCKFGVLDIARSSLISLGRILDMLTNMLLAFIYNSWFRLCCSEVQNFRALCNMLKLSFEVVVLMHVVRDILLDQRTWPPAYLNSVSWGRKCTISKEFSIFYILLIFSFTKLFLFRDI